MTIKSILKKNIKGIPIDIGLENAKKYKNSLFSVLALMEIKIIEKKYWTKHL